MTSPTRMMIERIREKIRELEQTITVIQALDDGPKSQWEHVIAALDQLGHPSNVKTLVATMKSNGWDTESKNPNALLTVTLRTKEKQGQVLKMGRGLWGKVDWSAAATRKVRKIEKTLRKAKEGGAG